MDEQEAYENLANAIILLAVQDYKQALIHQRRHPESLSAKKEAERQERFFFSEWYETLTNLNGSYLTQRIKEEIENRY